MPWKFVYYDPNYDCKIAYNNGKKIQFKNKASDVWLQSDFEPKWSNDCDYRIKPEEPDNKRMTHCQLAEWLAKGNGQYRYMDLLITSTDYREKYDNDEVSEVIKIRRWHSNEWIEPTYDVYKKDVLKEE